MIFHKYEYVNLDTMELSYYSQKVIEGDIMFSYLFGI
jgi:hypothetical protein